MVLITKLPACRVSIRISLLTFLKFIGDKLIIRWHHHVINSASTDGAGQPRLSVHTETLPLARHGARVKKTFCFNSGPMSGPVAFKRITVTDFAPAPSIIRLPTLRSHVVRASCLVLFLDFVLLHSLPDLPVNRHKICSTVLTQSKCLSLELTTVMTNELNSLVGRYGNVWWRNWGRRHLHLTSQLSALDVKIFTNKKI